MDAHHRQPLILTLVMTIVLAGMATTGTAQGDDPNVQEPFAASWESVTLAVTAYNPAENPDIDPSTRKNVITVSGKVYTFDTNDLVALSTTNPRAYEAFDQNGLAMTFDPSLPEPNLVRTWVLGDQPQDYSVEVHLDPDQTVPISLSQLDLTVKALYGQPFSIIEMAPEVTEGWIEVGPYYRLRIEEANMVDDVCTIVIKAEATNAATREDRDLSPNEIWIEDVTRKGIVIEMSDYDIIAHSEVIDTAETPSWDGGSFSHSSLPTDEGGYDSTWRFVLQNCTGIENLLIRHAVVVYPYEVAIPLTVTNVTIPGL